MSDFGTLISIFRIDKKDLNKAELSKIELLTRNIKGQTNYTDSLGEELSFHIVEAEESTGGKGVNILLSEYWGGEESEDEMIDFTESDKEQAENIAQLLINQLAPEYKIEVYAGGW
jgi:hypothetical protein